jgi:type I restriction enzyme S subunit
MHHIHISSQLQDQGKWYLTEALRSKEGRMQIEAAATGTGGAMKNISQADIRRFRVPVPDLDTQRRAAFLAQEVAGVRQRVEQHLSKARLCTKNLLEELCSLY